MDKYVILFLLLILLLKWQMLVQKNLVQGALCLCACSRLSVNTIERTILTAKEKKSEEKSNTVTEYVKRDPSL